jgi:sigma-B regulation protein RsbU (phosphoserine phosphatase)
MRSALVPDALPERPGLEIATCFLPANEDVGGDFFVVSARGDATVFVLGDVVGRGLDAAMRASYVRTVLTSITRFEQDPARVLTLTNDALMGDREEGTDFITAVCLTYEPTEHRVSWALAGHPPPLLLDRGTELDVVGQPGPPLAVAEDFTVTAHSATLEPGGGVLLYTDGITEARRGADFYGTDRLHDAVAAAAGSDPAAVVEAIREDMQEFAGSEFNDDVCMLAIRARASAARGDAEEVCSPDLISGSAATGR